MGFDLAQVNMSRLLAPIDSPVLTEFVAALDEVNAGPAFRPSAAMVRYARSGQQSVRVRPATAVSRVVGRL